MAYKIGNTVVIDDSAQLGSIDGNSLNLTNNANISGGGSGSLYTTTTPGATAGIGSTVTLAMIVGGGGAAAYQTPFPGGTRFSGGGSGAPTRITAFDSSPVSSVDVTIGAGGTHSAPTTANAGGASSLTIAGNVQSAIGGRGSIYGPNQTPNATGFGAFPGNNLMTYEAVSNSKFGPFGIQVNDNPQWPAMTNAGWLGQGPIGGATNTPEMMLEGSPGSFANRIRNPFGAPQFNTKYTPGGTSLLSSHNTSQKDATNFAPGNNFGYGQGGVGFHTSSQYINLPGNMNVPNRELDANVRATSGCVLLIGV
jgi:hypothetical protein